MISLNRTSTNTSSLPLFIIMSLGIHMVGLSFFVFLSPTFIEKQSTKIILNINSNSSLSKIEPTFSTPDKIASSKTPTKTIKEKTKPVLKKTTPTIENKIVKKVKAVQKKSFTPTVAKEIRPVLKTPTITEQPIKEEINKPPPQTIEPLTIEKEIPNEVKKVSQQQQLASELDNLLKKRIVKTSPTDFLANATWSGTPRKTISFPKLATQIPQQYKSRGYGFSVTAKITFSPQGWVSSVQLVHTSGDPRIDNIFRTELRKIRIEESKKNTYDTITKTFTVSVK